MDMYRVFQKPDSGTSIKRHAVSYAKGGGGGGRALGNKRLGLRKKCSMHRLETTLRCCHGYFNEPVRNYL